MRKKFEEAEKNAPKTCTPDNPAPTALPTNSPPAGNPTPNLDQNSRIQTSFTVTNNSPQSIVAVKLTSCDAGGNCSTTTKPVNIPSGSQQSVQEAVTTAVSGGRYTLSCVLVDYVGRETICPQSKTTTGGDGVKFNLTLGVDGTATGSAKTSAEIMDRNSDGAINSLDYVRFIISPSYGQCKEGLEDDITGDNCINALDISKLLDALGKSVIN